MGDLLARSCGVRGAASLVGAVVLLTFITGASAAPTDLGQQIKTRLEDTSALTAKGVTLDRDTLASV